MNGFDSHRRGFDSGCGPSAGDCKCLARQAFLRDPAVRPVSQYLFFAILPLMGVATSIALAVGPGCWATCAATLAIMVLTVTCDFRGSRQATTW